MRLLIAFALVGMTGLAHATDWDLPPAAIDKTCSGAGSDAQITDCAIKATENADRSAGVGYSKSPRRALG
jgi:hypothetical protein